MHVLELYYIHVMNRLEIVISRHIPITKPGLEPKPAQARPYQGPKAGLCLLASPGPLKPGPSPGF